MQTWVEMPPPVETHLQVTWSFLATCTGGVASVAGWGAAAGSVTARARIKASISSLPARNTGIRTLAWPFGKDLASGGPVRPANGSVRLERVARRPVGVGFRDEAAQ